MSIEITRDHVDATDHLDVILRDGKQIGYIWEPHKADGKRDIYLKIPGLDGHAFLAMVDDADQAVRVLEDFFS